MAPTTEIATWCWLARSPTWSETPSTVMMNTASRRRVAVSLGSREPKRMIPSSDRRAPTKRVAPSTRSALANSEPRIDAWATTTSPAESANRTTKSSGRLPSVDWSTPVMAGPKRSPTASV